MSKKIVLALLLVVAIGAIGYVGLWRWGLERTWVPPGYSLQLTRLTGTPAGSDKYAGPGQQGVVEKMLGPGRHFLAPCTYSTKLVKACEVPPGHIALASNNV